MKLFYFLDFLHVKKYGRPVTYDTYVNLEHGPIPSEILNLVNSVVDDPEHAILSDTISIERPVDINMQKIVCVKPFKEEDTRYLSDSEVEIIQIVCKRFGDKNTKYIEDASHKESPWKKTVELQTIPYTLAAEDSDCFVKKEDIALLARV